jgi:GH18 family chitinase
MKKLILILLLPVLMPAQTHQIGMYFQSWTYNSNIPASRIQNMNIDGLTYIIHIAGEGGTDYKATSPYWPGDSTVIQHGKADNATTDEIIDTLIATAHAHGAKALITLGCPFGSAGDEVAGDSTKTQTMVNSIVAFAKYHGYDGVELDWEEYDATAASMARLVRLLRQRLDLIYGDDVAWLTSAEFHGSAENFPGWMADYFTYFGMQCYDLTSNNDNLIGFNAPLYPPGRNTSYSLWEWQDSWAGWWNNTDDVNDWPTAHGGPRQFIAAGWPAEKLIIGCSQAGYVYNRDVNAAITVGNSATGTNRYQANQNLARLAVLYGGTRVWEDTAKVPYIYGRATQAFGDAYNGAQENGQYFYITYDDSASYWWKIKMVKDSGYAGIFMYDADIDWNGTSYLTMAQHAVTMFANEAGEDSYSITSTTLAGGTVGVSYSQQIVFTSPVTADVRVYVRGLPDGLWVNYLGLIQGVPTKAGVFTATYELRARFSRVRQTTGAISITIGS